jgi:hypothetical protein
MDDIALYAPDHIWAAVACYGARSLVDELAEKSNDKCKLILKYLSIACPWCLALVFAGSGVIPIGNALAIAGAVTTKWGHK